MRALVVFAALLFFVSPALAEQKAPDGFGPIKFGMTIEEAREATGGEDRWVNDDTMVSKQGLPSKLKNNFDIMIDFDKDMVSRIVIKRAENEQERTLCISDLQFIITMIYRKYLIQPIYIKSLNIELNTREEYYFIFRLIII